MERLTWKEIQEKYPKQWVGLILADIFDGYSNLLDTGTAFPMRTKGDKH